MNIHKMKLHDRIEDDVKIIERVPGGWNYIYKFNGQITSLNVPYSKEFDPKKVSKPTQQDLFKFDFKLSLLELGVDNKLVADWLKVRSKKKASNTESAFRSLELEIKKSKLSARECITECIKGDWKGFKAEWLDKNKSKNIGHDTDF